MSVHGGTDDGLVTVTEEGHKINLLTFISSTHMNEFSWWKYRAANSKWDPESIASPLRYRSDSACREQRL